jgi:hypothetical protein
VILAGRGLVRRGPSGNQRFFEDTPKSFTCFATDASGKRAVLGDEAGGIRILELPAMNVLDTLSLASAHDWPRSLVVSPDGKFFLACTARGVVLRFDLP